MFTGSWVFAVSVTRSFRVHSTVRQKGGVGLRLNQLQAQSTGQELNYKLTPQRTCQGSLTDYHHSCSVSFEENNNLFCDYTTTVVVTVLRVGKFLHEDPVKYNICFLFLSTLKLGITRNGYRCFPTYPQKPYLRMGEKLSP